MQPRRKRNLAKRQLSITSQTLDGVHIAAYWKIGPVCLSQPESHRLGDQLLELEIAANRYDIDRVIVTPAQALMRDHTLWQQDVITEGST